MMKKIFFRTQYGTNKVLKFNKNSLGNLNKFQEFLEKCKVTFNLDRLVLAKIISLKEEPETAPPGNETIRKFK